MQSTLTVASNEYKYVAELETEFGVLPQVTCHAEIVVTDANGKHWVQAVNATGNFSEDGVGFVYPYTAKVRFG